MSKIPSEKELQKIIKRKFKPTFWDYVAITKAYLFAAFCWTFVIAIVATGVFGIYLVLKILYRFATP